MKEDMGVCPNGGRRRYAVVGVGGVGGYFGGRLAQAGFDVRFLLHSDYEWVRDRGLRVRSYMGDFALPRVQAYAKAEDVGVVDVVLVCLKTTREELVRELVRPMLGEGTVVVLIQNGIGVEGDVAKMLPGVGLVGGMAFICATKEGPGEVWHQFFGSINLAGYNVGDDVVRGISEDFGVAGVPTHVMGYADARWRKALWNVPFNGLSVIMGMQTDGLTRGAAGKLSRAVMGEVKEAAQALGVGITDKDCDDMMDMTHGMPAYSPSMRVDYDRGREMELEYLYRRVVEAARGVGVRMWRVETMLEMLEGIEGERGHC